LSTIVTETEWVDEGTVYFIFPAHIFKDKDWLLLELTFDNITWAVANTDRLAVVK